MEHNYDVGMNLTLVSEIPKSVIRLIIFFIISFKLLVINFSKTLIVETYTYKIIAIHCYQPTTHFNGADPNIVITVELILL